MLDALAGGYMQLAIKIEHVCGLQCVDGAVRDACDLNYLVTLVTGGHYLQHDHAIAMSCRSQYHLCGNMYVSMSVQVY